MKINWKKIFNPNKIDFKKLREMPKAEADAYVKEIYAAEWAKVYVRYAWLMNYLCMTNTWQYIMAVWLA